MCIIFFIFLFLLDTLFSEYDEANQAAEKLLADYSATSTTTIATSSTKKTRILPLGRDEKKIYPFSISSTTNSYDETNNEYDYATNDEYDEDDEDEIDKKSTSTTTTTTTIENDSINYDQVEAGDSDWDITNDETEATFDLKIDDQNQQAFINEVNLN